MKERHDNKQLVDCPKAVIYLRTVSREPGGEEAINRQRQACEEAARELGVTVVCVHADRGSRAFRERPGLRAMMSLVAKSTDIGYIIVAWPEVLGTNIMRNGGMRMLLRYRGVRVIAADDIPSDAGRQTVDVVADGAEQNGYAR